MTRAARHRHEWTEVGRTFNPPTLSEFKITGHLTPDDRERMLYGITVVELHCTCGDVGFRTVAGRAPKPPAVVTRDIDGRTVRTTVRRETGA